MEAEEMSSDASPLPAIGRQFGGRDHTTVLYAWRRACARIASDESTRRGVEELCERLDSNRP